MSHFGSEVPTARGDDEKSPDATRVCKTAVAIKALRILPDVLKIVIILQDHFHYLSI